MIRAALKRRAAQLFALFYREFYELKERPIELIIRTIFPCLILVLLVIIQRTGELNFGNSLYDQNLSFEISTLEPPKEGLKYVFLLYNVQGFNVTCNVNNYDTVYDILSIIGKRNGLTINNRNSCLRDLSKCNSSICLVLQDYSNRLSDKDLLEIQAGADITVDSNVTPKIFYATTFPDNSKFLVNPFFGGSTPKTKQTETMKFSLMNAFSKAFNEYQIGKDINVTFSMEHTAILKNMSSVYLSKNFVTFLTPMCLIFVIFLCSTWVFTSINRERELRMFMKLYGLTNLSYFLFRFIVQLIYITLISFLLTAIGYACQITFFLYCDNPLWIFVGIFSIGLYFSSFNMFISTFIRGEFSSNFCLIGLLFSNILFLCINMDFFNLTSGARFLPPQPLIIIKELSFIYIFPTYCFGLFSNAIISRVQYVLDIESNLWTQPAHFSNDDFYNNPLNNIFQNSYYRSQALSPNFCVLIILLQAIIFFILTLYFDNIISPKFGGSRLPWYYLFLPKYWGIGNKFDRNDLAIDVDIKSSEKFNVLEDIDQDVNREFKETIENHLNPDVAISVFKISKTFTSLFKRKNNKTALQSVSFQAMKGQTISLLGHNGAGKSTLISILTGLTSPSSGDALINKHSTVNHFEQVKQNIGVCMQQDFILPEFTAYQHLMFFGLLRGIPQKDLKEEIEDKLKKVYLTKFKDVKTKVFSGGMKRRINIATSMMGNPSIIFLDEPTSGIDVFIKRKIWDMITEYKKNDKTVILTTHDMEEAENIGDKIIVMALGKVRACGDVLHLKKRWGAGYQVKLFTKDIDTIKNELNEKYNPNRLQFLIENKEDSSLIYKLNMSSKKIGEFLNYTNQHKNIKDYALTFTSLKDVFLQVTHGGTTLNLHTAGTNNESRKEVSHSQNTNLLSLEAQLQEEEILEDEDKIPITTEKEVFHIKSEITSFEQLSPSFNNEGKEGGVKLKLDLLLSEHLFKMIKDKKVKLILEPTGDDEDRVQLIGDLTTK
ncbi:hypothetical protein ABK040_002488 [Willaertia magna]